jgi:hypothetical protein
MYSEFMTWLEGSALGHLMRDTGVWTYAVVNLTHILGIAALFGAILVLDLRMLGVWRRVPLAELAAPAVAVAGTGFVVAVLSGCGLLATKATEYLGNPFIPIKFAAILLGLLNVAAIHHLPAWKARASGTLTGGQERQLAFSGGFSLACWLIAIAAGRMVGYW